MIIIGDYAYFLLDNSHVSITNIECMRTRSFYLGLFLKSLRNDQKCIKPKKKKN